MKAGHSDYPLNLRKIFATKNPKIADRLPGWLIKFLNRIIFVNDLNYLLTTHRDLPPYEFSRKVIEYVGLKYKVIGQENIPDERCVFASNHPLGGLDGLVVISALSPHCKNGIKLIVNDLLMHLEPMRPIFIPVNKHGKQSPDYLKAMDEAFGSDCQIVTFPAGLCSRFIDGCIQDIAWHKNFAAKASKSGRLIVPVYFEGRNSMFFYRLAKLRKFLKIKFNVEMLFLPKEMFRPTIKEVVIHIGKPFSPEECSSATEITERARREAYAMAPQQK